MSGPKGLGKLEDGLNSNREDKGIEVRRNARFHNKSLRACDRILGIFLDDPEMVVCGDLIVPRSML